MKHECVANVNCYISSMTGDMNCFYNQMNRYAIFKEYDTSFCDLMPYIMANALREHIIIMEKTGHRHTLSVIRHADSDLEESEIRNLTCLYNAIIIYKEECHYDACICMTPGLQSFSSAQAKSQSSAVIDSRPVPWKNYSLNQFIMSSAYDLDLSSEIVFENGTIKRLPTTQNSCVNHPLQAKADSGNGADNMDDDSDTWAEYVMDYLHYAQKYCINHPRNCIIGHLNINSIRNKFDAVECILNEGLLDVFAI